MKSFFRAFVVLALSFTMLIYSLGDFNEYVTIEGKEYVEWKPSTAVRWAYGIGIAAPVAFVLSFAFIAFERKPAPWFGLEFLTLLVLAMAYLYFFGDLNMYVIGHGPNQRDWVKGRSEGGQRVLASLLLGVLWATLSAALLGIVRTVTTRRDSVTNHLDLVDHRS